MDANPQLALFLKSIPLFSLVEAPEMMDLLRLLRPLELSAGQVLFRESDTGTAMWVLAEGCEVAVSTTPDGSGRPLMVAQMKSGDTVGEMALVDEGGRSGTAVVTRGGKAHEILAVDFQVLRDNFSPAAFKVLRKVCIDLCARLRATSDRIVPSGAQPGGSEALEGKPITAEVVNAFPPFSKLPELVKLALTQKLRLVETTGVQPIFGEGDPGDAAYFVISGQVSVGRSGKTLANLGVGSMFGIVAVIDNGGRSASCLATEPTRLLRLGKAEFDQLFSSGNKFAFQLVDLVARQLVTHLRQANALLPIPGQSAGVAPPPMPPPPPMALEALEGELDFTFELER